jgi:hypothetical protein
MKRNQIKMNVKLVFAGALVAASLAIATPASALTKSADGSIVCQDSDSPSSYAGEQFDASGASLATFSGGVDTSFGEPTSFTAIDNNTNTLYLLSTGSLYSTDLINEGDATQIGDSSAVGDVPSTRGLAVDDTSGVLYASSFDSGSGDYSIFKFNATSGEFEAHKVLTSADITDGGNLAFFAGHIYVLDIDSGKIVVFNATTGAQTRLIEPAPDHYNGYNAALHVTAEGNIMFFSETSTGTDYGLNYYSLATSTWGPNIDAVEMESWYNFTYCTWWGDAEGPASPELANTGVDALSIGLMAGSVLTAGIALAVVRRRISA